MAEKKVIEIEIQDSDFARKIIAFDNELKEKTQRLEFSHAKAQDEMN